MQTSGKGFVEITREAARFVAEVGGKSGVLLVFSRHTSASLLIQENADPDVRVDLITALDRLVQGLDISGVRSEMLLGDPFLDLK